MYIVCMYNRDIKSLRLSTFGKYCHTISAKACRRTIVKRSSANTVGRKLPKSNKTFNFHFVIEEGYVASIRKYEMKAKHALSKFRCGGV